MYEVWIIGQDGKAQLYERARSKEKCYKYLLGYSADVLARSYVLKHNV